MRLTKKFFTDAIQWLICIIIGVFLFVSCASKLDEIEETRQQAITLAKEEGRYLTEYEKIYDGEDHVLTYMKLEGKFTCVGREGAYDMQCVFPQQDD